MSIGYVESVILNIIEALVCINTWRHYVSIQRHRLERIPRSEFHRQIRSRHIGRKAKNSTWTSKNIY